MRVRAAGAWCNNLAHTRGKLKWRSRVRAVGAQCNSVEHTRVS